MDQRTMILNLSWPWTAWHWISTALWSGKDIDAHVIPPPNIKHYLIALRDTGRDQNNFDPKSTRDIHDYKVEAS